jgi:hypothetical protein
VLDDELEEVMRASLAWPTSTITCSSTSTAISNCSQRTRTLRRELHDALHLLPMPKAIAELERAVASARAARPSVSG